MCGRRVLSLLARVLEMSLNTILHRLIGRNSVIRLGLFVFGMRAMLVLFSSAMDKLLLRTLRTILVIHSPQYSNIFDKIWQTYYRGLVPW